MLDHLAHATKQVFFFPKIFFFLRKILAEFSLINGRNSLPSRYVKLNIDGSPLGNPGYSRDGGVFCDSDGNILSGFSSFLGSTTNMEAKALACWRVCNFLWRTDSTICKLKWILKYY